MGRPGVTTEIADEVREYFRQASSLRSRLYLFLSTAFHFPSEEVIGVLRTPEKISVIDEIAELLLVPSQFTGIGDSFQAAIISAHDLTRLQVEYTRLFVGPFRLPCPPYESVYRAGSEGRVMGQSTLLVRGMYLAEGLDLSDAIRDLPDHIIIETEFMSFLAAQEAGSWAGSIGQVLRYVERQDVFLTEHLGQWIQKFCRAVVAHAREAFYRHLAEITAIVISLDRDYMRALRTSLTHGDTGNADHPL